MSRSYFRLTVYLTTGFILVKLFSEHPCDVIGTKFQKKEVKGFFREESPGIICWVTAYQDICHQ